MSILQLEIPGSRALDLFAGSGALGLELLSRGAERVDFVENDPRTLRILRENIELLGAEDLARVHRANAIRFVKELEENSFDVAVADPPYAGGSALEIARVWLERPFARILSVEHDSRENLPGGVDTRRYGTAAITFYRREE
jgi:16S rRNA (guanine966-N2)-methyltransferase